MINKRSKTTYISSLEDGDKDITDSQQVADATNQYFCNIREKLSNKTPIRRKSLLLGDAKINQHSKIFRFKDVDDLQIHRIMKSLKTSNGFGLDGISSYVLKVGMPVLASSLSIILNTFLRQGGFPVAKTVVIGHSRPNPFFLKLANGLIECFTFLVWFRLFWSDFQANFSSDVGNGCLPMSLR